MPKIQLTIEERVKRIRKYIKVLDKVSFMLSQNSDGTVRIRYGKRFIILDAPDRNCGDNLVAQFKAVVDSEKKSMTEYITLVEKHCEQLELSLFTEAKNGKSISDSGEKEGLVSNQHREADTGSEQSQGEREGR